ncbi:MAG: glutamate--tRNA ligase [Cryobacterium sp.]|nr:glutamate--tRNA ligase [Oligoflexia bacterium]
MTDSSSAPVRVRFAPSPTGYLHVGGARSMLFNYLFAKKHGGKLILRIEDTDQDRSKPEYEKMLLADVESLGMKPDESSVVGGPFPPYRQSERLSIYGKYATELLSRDQAYYCFCPDEILTQKRELAMKLGRPPVYDGTCAKIPLAEAKARVAKGEKAGIRFRAFSKEYLLKDGVKGDVRFPPDVVGDFFITRTPRPHEKEIADGIGMPVYNFCCVIDDHEMGMTHIIRGDDHLSNTARQLQIYDAFGWETPIFAHIAMVLGSDRQKLSKRNGDSSVTEYLANGYLPEALLNFLALLGWNPGSEVKPSSGHPEIFTMEEMISYFSMHGLHKAPAVFDVQKLLWMNGQYIRNLPLEEIAKRARPFFEKAGWQDTLASHGEAWYLGVVDTIRGECGMLSDLPNSAKIFIEPSPQIEDAAKAMLVDPANAAVFVALATEVEALPEALTAELVDQLQKSVGAKAGAKGKGLFMPIRAATTGKTHGPELKKVFPLLGKKALLARMAAISAQAHSS